MSKQQVSIGIKIFGIAASMLGLLLTVVYISSNRLRQVSQEIEGLAEYIIPITNAVAQVDIHTLEQEVLFERILKHYAIAPPDMLKIGREISEFERYNRVVYAELRAATQQIENAIAHLVDTEQRAELSALVPKLQAAEQAHQDFHEHALVVFQALADQQNDQATQLATQLAEEEDQLAQDLEIILLELETLTITAAQQSQLHQHVVQRLSVAIAILATIVGSVGAWLVTLGLVRPVQQLTDRVKALQAGDLNAQAQVSSRDEIATLAIAFNHMVDELRTKAQLEDTFGKYVDPRVVKQLLAHTDESSTVGNRQVMTVSFADVQGFREQTQQLQPEALVAVTNQYFNLMAQPITAECGVIDKFIDTTVMGFWGPPFADAQTHAERAVTAAFALHEQLSKIQELLNSGSSNSLALRVGIATGALVAGNMGSTKIKSYTVMGDTVNTASRLKGVCKQYGIAIALTQDSQAMLSDRWTTRELDLIQVVGKEESVRVYELFGETASLTDIQRQQQTDFAAGLAAYRQQAWDIAQFHFAACSTPEHLDPPALIYLQRLEILRRDPPDLAWDGVWHLTQK